MFSELKFAGKSVSASRRLPPCLQRGGVLRVDVVGRADLGVAARRRRRLGCRWSTR